MIKKTIIKRMSIIFDIKTKQNQMKRKKIEKKKKNPKQIKIHQEKDEHS